MDKIKIIQMGLGGIGQGVVRMLAEKGWAEVVGAGDVDSQKIGKDLGNVVGLDRQLGVKVTDDAESLFTRTSAEILIHATSSRTLPDIYPEIIKPIEKGINIITPCMDVSDPYLYDPEVSAKIDELTKANNVTFLGIGSTQLAARVAVVLAETCREIRKLRFLAHADVSKFPMESYRDELGISLDIDDYHKALESGNIKGCNALKYEAALIAASLGIHLDEIRPRYVPRADDGGNVIETRHIFEGIKDDEIRVEYIYKFILDPEHQYYHEIIVDGIPSINARVDYSPDRGLEGTVVPLVNCIPYVINAKPGILKMMDLGPGFRPYT